MRILFIDLYTTDYDPTTVQERGLGGMQSAVCYLSSQLARTGHEVFLLNHTTTARVRNGVHCMPVSESASVLSYLFAHIKADVVIVVGDASMAQVLRPYDANDSRWVFWTGHSYDQPFNQTLSSTEARLAWDAYAFCGTWQMGTFVETFGIEADRSANLGYGFAPAFQGRFEPDERILDAKTGPPTLVYTSTPFRGLDRLLVAFPRIRAAVPDVRLKVFSSMAIYDQPELNEMFQALFDFAERTDGIELMGSVPQGQLADALHSAVMLAYPNTFLETHCIAVREALAAGCLVVTSDLAALPETSGGFADLVGDVVNQEGYIDAFVDRVVAGLRRLSEAPEDVEQDLRRQVDWVNENHTWAHNAAGWESWLGQVVARPRR